MRILALSLAASLFFSASALAHPEKTEPKPVQKVSELKLPTEAEVEQIIDNMPDFNKLMGAMMTVMQDEDVRESLKNAGESFAKSVEKSGIKDMTSDLEAGEMPDLNALFATMVRMTADDNVMGNMLDVMSELQESVEENIDEDLLKPKGE